MSNTPCAYAVSSVLHRRVEIKVDFCHLGLADLSVRFTAHGRQLPILSRMNIGGRLVALAYLLPSVFSMARTNCSGSFRSSFS